MKYLICLLALVNIPQLWALEKTCQSTYCKNTLQSLSDYKKLAATINLGTKNLAIVKVVYERDMQGNGDLYFINTKNFQYHYDFSKEFLKFSEREESFNLNYEGSGQKRRFNLASLVMWSKEQKIFLLELWNGDTLSAKYINELILSVKKDLKIPGAKIIYHPLGISQEVEVEKNTYDFPIIKTIDLFKDLDYIPLNKGIAYGYVKFVKEGEAPCLDNTSIAVFSKIPNDIGLIGGVIVEEVQTPLSHINIKSINRGTINIFLKNAKEKLRPFLGKPIKLEITGNDYKITVLPKREAELQIKNFWATRKPRNNFNPSTKTDRQYDNHFINLQNYFRSMPNNLSQKKLTSLIGAKATNIAILGKLARRNRNPLLKYFVPKGYGVPFNFYKLFMNHPQIGLDLTRPKLSTTPKNLLEDILRRHDILDITKEQSFCAIKPVLAEIREMITRAEVPDKMLNIFKTLLIEDQRSPIHQSKIAKIRLRSSTNMEDMQGFSGAGLYNSAGVWLYDKVAGIRLSRAPSKWKKIKKRLMKKIPFVYSSVWNDRAFEEREWYSVNGKKHLDIKMGIAIHRGFPFKELDQSTGEIANGVAITTDLNDPQAFEKVYLNSQHYDLAVTNPPTDLELVERGIDPVKKYLSEELVITTFLADINKNNFPDSWLNWSYAVLSRSSVMNGQPVLLDNPKSHIENDPQWASTSAPSLGILTIIN